MATIIDSLIVTLGLDPSGYKKGTDEKRKIDKQMTSEEKKSATIEAKNAKEREAQAKRAAEGIGKVRNEVLGLVAAFIGAGSIKTFMDRITQSDVALGRLSTNVGVSANSLLAWGGVAKQLGSSASDIESAFRTINKSKQQYDLEGKADIVPLLGRMTGSGEAGAQFFGAKDNEARLRLLADAAQKAGPQKAQYWLGQAGFSEDTINVLLKGGSVLDKLLAEQHKRNQLTKEDIALELARTQAWQHVTDRIDGLGRVLMNTVTPAFTKFGEVTEKVIGWLQSHLEFTIPLAVALGVAMLGLTAMSFAGVIGGIAKLTGGLGLAGTAATGLLGILGKLGLVAVVAALADAAVSAADPKDKLGAWIDKHIPGASWLDNQASRIGLGRSYAEQGGGADASSTASSASQSSSSKLFSGLEKAYSLPAGLLDSVWAQESGRGKNMRSPKGAMGHFQFMPDTAAQYGVRDPNDLTQSATGAARMLADLLKQFHGDLPKALAAYNWGSGNVQRKGMGYMPPETQRYIASIQARRNAGGGTTNTTTSDVKVQNVVINTKATDAKGIAVDFGHAMSTYAFASQANGGLN